MRSSCCSSLVTQVQVPRPQWEEQIDSWRSPSDPCSRSHGPSSLRPSPPSRTHIKSNGIEKENLIIKVTFLPVPWFSSFSFLKCFFLKLCTWESMLVCIMCVCVMPCGHYSVVLWVHNSWASSHHCNRHTHLMTARYKSNFTSCRVCCFFWRVHGCDAAELRAVIEWQLRKLSNIIAH